MTNVDEQITDFLFRGDRTYLQGGTAFDYLLLRDPNPVDIDFALHKMTDRQCSLSADVQSDRGDSLVATYRSGGWTRHLYETSQSMQGKYHCNESEIVARTAFEGPVASFAMPPIEGATYIEGVVGVYKRLLQDLYPDLTRKLLFARITVKRVPSDGPCRVEHKRKIGGEYYQSELFHEDHTIGKLVFGLL